MRTFIAGPQIIERDPLAQPLSTSGNSKYNQVPEYTANTINSITQQIQLRNFDLKHPDTQYLRYKHLMNSQFYNLQANSTSVVQAGGEAESYG